MKRLLILGFVLLGLTFSMAPVSASASQATISNRCVIQSPYAMVVTTLNYAGTGIADGTTVDEYQPAWATWYLYHGHRYLLRFRATWQTTTVVSGLATFQTVAPQVPGGPNFQFGLYPGDVLSLSLYGVC
jgi:hypothetical protein